MPSDAQSPGWRIWIDQGGTFTDIVARSPDGVLLTQKLLSTDAATLTGIRRLLGVPDGAPIPPGRIDHVKMGTTVATNALLQRTGAPTLLVVNTGFADLLRIGTQARPRLFDLAITRPLPLYAQILELPARLAADGTELTPLDDAAALAALSAAAASGLRSCAIALIHAWRYPAHEARLIDLARQAGFSQVSASHQVSPLLRLVPRAATTVADAYLSPVLRRHVAALAADLPGTPLYFMQSHGGLAGAASFRGKDAVLSGPAGGLVGAVRTAAAAGFDHVIGFDMGGTSTDVALYAGAYERTTEAEIAGVRLRTPMLAIHTVAAGGGSILHADRQRFRVGPDSAGADPGPAAYRNGGPLTVTDANLCLGRLQADHFPMLFGPGHAAPLDTATVRGQFAALAKNLGRTDDSRALAEGFLAIAVANMANAIRHVSVERGHDPARFVLQCFGGAGGQHACLVADALGIPAVLIHPLAGLLSACGIGLADRSALREQAVERILTPALVPGLHTLADTLAAQAGQDLGGNATERRHAHLRQHGADAPLAVPLTSAPVMAAAFAALHQTRFGFAPPNRPIMVNSISVELTLPGEPVTGHRPAPPRPDPPIPIDHIALWAAGRPHRAPVHARATLHEADTIPGPAVITQPDATTVVDPGWTATVTGRGDIVLRRVGTAEGKVGGSPGQSPLALPSPVSLDLFANRFMAIAEQAGAMLRHTAHSVNIKERLDFSCAIFSAAGDLIANAPHVPVHLGAMGDSVRTVLRRRGGRLRPGDVIALNNPYDGGTHLPDITAVTPVFDTAGTLRCLVGARGHHADIGGLTPGSTPAHSRRLTDEGVVIDDFLLVDAGAFREATLRDLLTAGRHPARNPDMNVADLMAQIAANAAAARALVAFAADVGWDVIGAQMAHLLDHAEAVTRRLMSRLPDGDFDLELDDGAHLRVSIRIDRAAGAATIDFSGTDAQRDGNFNAPRSVTRAAVLYVVRCLVGADIPLNDGCLRPVTLIIPRGCFLDPVPGAAVVAGNTEVSQAVCSALLGALGAAACSQSTMNNLLLGSADFQYYETICGGAGAGPGFSGADAVHTHMTNTHMTDPELLELRLPVRVEEFSVRAGSGGTGRNRGGNGARRRLRALSPMAATLVASGRKIPPFGLDGGEPGAPGDQWVDRCDGTRIGLAGRADFTLQGGDTLTILSPGGGGFGAPAALPSRDRPALSSPRDDHR